MEAGICASYKELVDNQTKVLPDRFHSHAPRAIDPVAISKSVLLPTAASHRPQPARGEKGGAQAGATASSAIIICDSPPAGASSTSCTDAKTSMANEGVLILEKVVLHRCRLWLCRP